jgi:hypothetical protein
VRAPNPDAARRRLVDERELQRGRATAAYLTTVYPGWYVMYGPSTRAYWAWPTWHGSPAGLVLDDADPIRLQLAMRQAETAHQQPAQMHRGGADLPPTPPRRGDQPTGGDRGQFADD